MKEQMKERKNYHYTIMMYQISYWLELQLPVTENIILQFVVKWVQEMYHLLQYLIQKQGRADYVIHGI